MMVVPAYDAVEAKEVAVIVAVVNDDEVTALMTPKEETGVLVSVTNGCGTTSRRGLESTGVVNGTAVVGVRQSTRHSE